MATATASTYLKQPRVNVAGVVSVHGKYGTDLSVGDVVKIARLPNRAVILDGLLTRESGGGDVSMRLRDYSASGSSTVLATILNSTASGRAQIVASAVDLQLSVSDDVIAKRFVDVELLCSSAAATATFNWYILYSLQDRA